MQKDCKVFLALTSSPLGRMGGEGQEEEEERRPGEESQGPPLPPPRHEPPPPLLTCAAVAPQSRVWCEGAASRGLLMLLLGLGRPVGWDHGSSWWQRSMDGGGEGGTVEEKLYAATPSFVSCSLALCRRSCCTPPVKADNPGRSGGDGGDGGDGCGILPSSPPPGGGRRLLDVWSPNELLLPLWTAWT
jgi:hypothetical protein